MKNERLKGQNFSTFANRIFHFLFSLTEKTEVSTEKNIATSERCNTDTLSLFCKTHYSENNK